jgi:outer membrane protein assembly factor BamB
MRSFDVVLARTTSPLANALESRTAHLFEVFLNSANVTARIRETQVESMVRDFCQAVSELVRNGGKRIVRFYDEPCELCVERAGEIAFVSVYRGGLEPAVYAYDVRVSMDSLVLAAQKVLGDLDAARKSGAFFRREERSRMETELGDYVPTAPSNHEEEAIRVVEIEASVEAGFSLGATIGLRPRPDAPEPTVESTDLHALLFAGELSLGLRGRTFSLGRGFPFLLVEQLQRVAREVLDAWSRGVVRQFLLELPNANMIVRSQESGQLALVLRGEEGTRTFPNLSAFEFVEAVLTLSQRLVRALLRADRTQAKNLRLLGMRLRSKELSDELRSASEADDYINPSPSSYRVYVPQNEHGQSSASSEVPSSRGDRLRYEERWKAMVPGIDLRATFLCGNKFVIGTAREMFCLSRDRGELLWRTPVDRGVSVVTPSGVARVGQEGQLTLHAMESGEALIRTWLSPRKQGPASGAVVASPGLPRLLIVTEGEKHIVAWDLMSGELRWRFAWGGGETLRFRRLGRLLYLVTGSASLAALDVVTGEVVWRRRDRFRFRHAPIAAGQECWAIAGGQQSPAVLHGFDAHSGETRHSLSLGRVQVEGTPILAGQSVVVPIREQGQVTLAAWDRQTGESQFRARVAVAPGSAWLAVDDRLVGNSPCGRLVAIDTRTGTLAYERSFGKQLASDVPRKLEPILRNGALFVPQGNVEIVRPRDGASIGSVSNLDAVPDLLRVDEKNDLYVAEESGHVAAFGVGHGLRLIKSA